MRIVWLISVLSLFAACSGKDATPTNNPANSVDSISHGYNELANPDQRKNFSVSDYNTDNDAIENIARPVMSTIQTSIDTTLLFHAWTTDADGPHADFDLSAESFYMVDYNGNGDMPYELTDHHIKIYYNDFIQEGDIVAVSEDSLQIKWMDNAEVTAFVRWRK